MIGAGVMGSGIAAQIANAGVPVLLSTSCRRARTIAARSPRRRSPGSPRPIRRAFMMQDAARLVTPGNLEDDLERLADVDWIVEAVVESLEIKRALYARLEARPPARLDRLVQHLDPARLPS